MAKEHGSAEHTEKKHKRERATDAATEEGSVAKKAKKDKKDKKEKKSRKSVDGAVATAQGAAEPEQVSSPDAMDVDGGAADNTPDLTWEEIFERAANNQVIFSNPRADMKATKKLLKGIKRASKYKTLKRGVAEVQKALEPNRVPAQGSSSRPFALCIIAGDVWPMDVISHLPVCCEDVNVPYQFIVSRHMIGLASNTKRPTSVILIYRDVPKPKAKNGVQPTAEQLAAHEKSQAEWVPIYEGLADIVVKASENMVLPTL